MNDKYLYKNVNTIEDEFIVMRKNIVDILEISHSVAGPNVEKSNAAFTPVQQVARNLMLVARNKLRVARSLLRATCCAGVNAAEQRYN